MFAPNRLLTVKEQWLLAGIMAAVLVGAATVYYRGYRPADSTDELILEAERSGLGIATTPPKHDKFPVGNASLPGTPVAEEQGISEKPVSSAPQSSDATIPPLQLLAAETEAEPRTIGVAAMGAIRKPGLYMTPATYRVADLIALAGGATEAADLSEIALTAALIDETTLTIPEQTVPVLDGSSVSARRMASQHTLNPAQYLKRSFTVPGSPAQPMAAYQGNPQPIPETASRLVAQSTASGVINLNQATSEQLQQLPGIGPVLADAIIAERERQPFVSVDDLDRVHGIGEKRLAAIRSLVIAP